MHRFSCPEIPAPPSTAELSAEESHHLHRVLRVEVGEKVELVDGRGTLAVGVVVKSDAKRAQVTVETKTAGGPPSRLHLCFGVAKSQANDFIVHRCTEAGVAAFHPLVTRHSIHPDKWKGERWEKVIAEVAKQCQELHYPKMHEPVALDKFLATLPADATLVLCDENQREGDFPAPTGDVYLFIGAEGGWAPEERERLRQKGAKSLGLGRNRLRAETAALTASVLVKKSLGEM